MTRERTPSRPPTPARRRRASTSSWRPTWWARLTTQTAYLWSLALGTWEVAGEARPQVLAFVAFLFLCALGLHALAAKVLGR